MQKKKKYIAIGDIHGCIRSLAALLETLSAFDERVFVFVGDYIDRGPDSKGVIELLSDFSNSHECIFVRGNHEQMMLDAIHSGNFDLWLVNGGQETIRSYNATINRFTIPPDHKKFLEETRYYHNTPDYLFVHGGIPPDLSVKEALQNRNLLQEFIWFRHHLEIEQNIWEKKVVFGHTPMSEPINENQKIGIDTGCVYSYMDTFSKLTAIKLPEEEFIFQECLEYGN